MKLTLSLLAAATVVFGAMPVFAQEAPTAEEIIAQAPSGALAQIGGPQAAERAKLRLSDSQLEQLRALKDKFFADNTMKRAQLKILKHDLKNEMIKESIDKGAVLAVQAKINALQADINNARVSQMVDASAIFTPEQRKAMHSRMLRGGGHHRRGGKGGECGGRRGGGHHKFGGHKFGGPGGPAAPGAPRSASEGTGTASFEAPAMPAPQFES
jgi:Spy/CpxP family protein refolding chaperone